jgi:hypothetical protein
MARWGTQFGHWGIQTPTVGSGPQRHTTAGIGRRGGNGGAADARVGVVGKHCVAEAEFGDTEAAPDGGRLRLVTRRRSGGIGAVMRARGQAEAQTNCEVRHCTG